MTTDWLLRNLIATCLMPPASLVLLGLLASLLWFRKPRLARMLIVFSLLTIWLTSTTWMGNWLLQRLPVQPPLQLASLTPKDEQAIVVLGGGRQRGAIESPENGNLRLADSTMNRVLYAARVAKKTHLPVLTSGGAPDVAGLAEAILMRDVLGELGVKVRWVDAESATTEENAYYSARLLKAAGVRHIYLVTDFVHVIRARYFFERAGLVVTVAPCCYVIEPERTPIDYLPSTGGLERSRQALHEILGIVWASIGVWCREISAWVR